MPCLIIDGYNLIRQSHSLTRAEFKSLETGRLALIKKLSTYKQAKGFPIIVVFDAALTDNVNIERDYLGGIEILYSERNQPADDIIMDLAVEMKQNAIIVSSDNRILQKAEKAGSGILTSQEFEKRLNQTVMKFAFEDSLWASRDVEGPDRHDSKTGHKRWTTQKKGPSKKLPKSKRRALSKIREV